MSKIGFIVGPERSGTSWLLWCLSSHPEIVGIPETHVFSNEGRPDPDSCAMVRGQQFWRFLQATEDLQEGDHHEWNRSSRRTPLMVRTPAETIRELKGLYDRLESYDSWFDVGTDLFSTLGHLRPWIVEKTPWHVTRIDDIAQWNPEARFIGIIRDGRDVFASAKALNFEWAKPLQNLDWAAGHWSRVAEALVQAKTNRPEQTFVLRYEDLLENFNETLSSLFEFLGIRSDESLVQEIQDANSFKAYTGRNNGEGIDGRFLRKGISGTYLSDLTHDQILAYESLAMNQLAHFGYKIHTPTAV